MDLPSELPENLDVSGDGGRLGAEGDPLQTQLIGKGAGVGHPFAGENEVLGVFDDDLAQGLLKLQGPAEDEGGTDRKAVFREGDRSGLDNRAHLDKLLALLLPAHRRDGKDSDRRLRGGLVDDEGGDPFVIVHGQGVGHGRDGGETSRGGGTASAGDGLLVFETRFPQVNVHIDESGEDQKPFGVHGFRTGNGEVLPDLDDLPPVDEEIGLFVQLLGGVDNPTLLNDQAHWFLLRSDRAPPSSRQPRWSPGQESPTAPRRPPLSSARLPG
ncbi:MAG: hypothetical protein BWY86_00410 [Candidatus Aminicenantes bacterium ADurb.Bin508]|nr:MAG: hypothetical protein BWY86_00410 [Candidatus Aminicenantes bacterium ADurb.Bin508]